MKIPPNRWNLIKKNLRISSLGDYINKWGGISVRLQSNNAKSNLNVDFIKLRLTVTGDAPVSGPGELLLKDRFTFDLIGRFETYDTDMVIVDLFDIESSSIASYANNGVTVVCRFSAGTWEHWRPDNMEFDDNAIGNNVDGWPGEKWLDTVSGEVKKMMLNRITLAKQKSCHAIEVVKVNGYAHDTSFDLYPGETKSYILQLATKAHSEGLLFGLNGSQEISGDAANFVDFAVAENCIASGTCCRFKEYIKLNKPVFAVEYSDTDQAACNAFGKVRYSVVFSNTDHNFMTTCSARNGDTTDENGVFISSDTCSNIFS